MIDIIQKKRSLRILERLNNKRLHFEEQKICMKISKGARRIQDINNLIGAFSKRYTPTKINRYRKVESYPVQIQVVPNILVDRFLA